MKCPTCPDAEEDKCCGCNGELIGAELQSDPYADEICGDASDHYRCEDCLRESAREI